MIRSIGRFDSHLGPSLDHFPMVCIDIANPLEEMNPGGPLVALYEMDRRVVPPHHRVVVVAEVPVEAKHVSIERRSGFDVGDMKPG